jgi:hypothetical protein
MITLKSPLDNATNASRPTNIVATFDDTIVAGSGNITIKDLDDGSTTQVIPVSDTARVSISGKITNHRSDGVPRCREKLRGADCCRCGEEFQRCGFRRYSGQ